MPTDKLRVGLLIDSFEFSEWAAENVRFFHDHPQIEIALVVVNDAYPNNKQTFKSVFDRIKNNRALFYRFDAMDLRRAAELGLHETEADLTDQLDNVPVIRVLPKMTKFSDRFPEETVAEIESHNLDFIFRFGFRIIRGGILSCSRYGVFSFHHDDNDDYRGGPPGFWEVYENSPTSGVTLQILTDKLDGGVVFGKTYRRTHPTSPRINQLQLLRSGNILVHQLCEYLLNVQPTVEQLRERCHESPPYNKRIYVRPTNLQMLRFLPRVAFRSLKARLAIGNNIPRWSIGIAPTDKSKDVVDQIKNPQAKWFTPDDSCFVADPFAIERDGDLFVFVEQLEYTDWRGRIAVMKYDEADGFTQPETVLKTDFHLSFPFLVEDGDQLYMMPEQATTNQVVLYRCEEFPHKWVKDKVLLDDFAGADSVLHFDGELWWLFTTDCFNENQDGNLCIFYSDSLSGEFKPHKLNPVSSTLQGSRMAGPLIRRNGKLIRPGQNSVNRYGESISLFEIEVLTTEDYKEKRITIVQPSKGSRYSDCSHTIQLLENYVITDGMHVDRG